MIVGDSNLVKLREDLEQDPLLQSFNIETHCRPGMRAKFLGEEDLDFCSNFSHCILFLGNNDVSAHPTKPWLGPESPNKTASRLSDFAQQLREKNLKVAVIGLVPRPDVSYQVIKETNDLLKESENCSYVGPRKLHNNHFLKEHTLDLAHLNEDGKKRTLALFLRVITKRFKL